MAKTAGSPTDQDFLDDPLDCRETKKLLKLSRSQLRTIIGVFTGHWLVNYHLHKIGLSNGSECRFCDEVEETTSHLICFCDSLTQTRFLYLGDYYLEPTALRNTCPGKILSFLEGIGVSG